MDYNIEQIREQIVSALNEWMDSRIDVMTRGNARLELANKYLKRGAHNIIRQRLDDINDTINKMALFVVDDSGNIDLKGLFNDVETMFNSLPETQVSIMGINCIIGNGCVKIQMPRNAILSLLTDNVTAIKLTTEDMRDFFTLLKNE